MSVTGAVVLYAVSWFLALLLILPRGHVSQIEAGEIEPGTPASAPSTLHVGWRLLIVSVAAAAPVVALATIVHFELLRLDDFDFLYPASFKEPPAGR